MLAAEKEEEGEDVSEEYPYIAGPFEFDEYPEATGVKSPIKGKIWGT